MSEINWNQLGFIKSSKIRKQVLVTLITGPKTPAEIALKSHIRLPHVSRSLSQLLEKNIIICKNPKATKGKLYDLTISGKKLMQNLGDD
jgi:predicted transcriptional regulator